LIDKAPTPTGKSKDPKLFLIGGIVIAALAAFLVYVLLGHPGQTPTPQRTVDVVVAGPNGMLPNHLIVASDVQIVKYFSDQVPVDTASGKNDWFSSIGQISDPKHPVYTTTKIAPLSPITTGMIGTTLNNPVLGKPILSIPKGDVAIAIPSGGDLQNVAGFIQSGDHIDILASSLPGQRPGEIHTTFTDLIIQLAGAPAGGSATGATAPAANGVWVVFVPIQEAEQLSYLFTNSQYKFVLRSREDYSTPEGTVPPVGKEEFNATFGIH
jgi:Flp pilus assembly protein CpaB